MKYEELRTNANRIIEVSNSILTIYNELFNAKIKNNIEKYNEYLAYLRISIEVEKNIYDDIKEDNDNYEYFLNTVYLEIQNKNYQEQDIESIITRIENHLIYKTYSNPIYIDSEDIDENLEHNTAKIYYRVNNQYKLTLFNELNQEIINEKDQFIKDELTYSKFNIIYTNKDIEIKLLNNFEIKPDNGKLKLLRCNHDEEMIEVIYDNYILDTFNASLNLLLNIKDNNLSKQNIVKQKLNLLTLKSCLKQLDKESLINLYNSFYDGFLSDTIKNDKKEIASDSIEKIKKTLNELINEKQNNNIIKQKK